MNRFEYINNNLINIISQYLDTKDLISLYYSDNISKEILYNTFIENILIKLKNIFKSNYIHVLNLLKNNEVSITGSFVLESILNDNYCGDVDFCCNINLIEKCKEFLTITDAYNTTISKDYPGMCDWKVKKNMNNIEKVIKSYIIMISIIDGKNYRNSKELQFILLNTENHYDYINTFDISVCKNLFYYSKENKKFELSIYDLEGIYNKTMKIDITRTKNGRIEKYLNRGFKIIGENYIEILLNIQYYNYNIYKINLNETNLNEINLEIIKRQDILKKCKITKYYQKDRISGNYFGLSDSKYINEDISDYILDLVVLSENIIYNNEFDNFNYLKCGDKCCLKNNFNLNLKHLHVINKDNNNNYFFQSDLIIIE